MPIIPSIIGKALLIQLAKLLRPVTLLKRNSNTCFHVKFAKFLRAPILKNICERLLLSIISSTNSPDVS